MSDAKPKSVKMCFDRILPSHLRRPQRSIPYGTGRTRAISLKGKSWINGSTIRIRFVGGTNDQQNMVREIAPEWTEYANLKFEFSNDPRAEIRVDFDSSDGAWSYVGTDNLSIPLHATTLNLGWQDEGVILHEFGHMIGLSHEHQNPSGGIRWNEQAVIDDLSGPPNWWDEDTVRHNVLNKYSADQINGTDFDENSIMLYAFPNAWTIGDFETHDNEALSAIDKAFVAGAKMYPGAEPPGANATELSVAAMVEGEIGAAGEEDLYKFAADRSARYKIATTGSTDVYMSLYGPNSETRLVSEDDDSGAGRNAMLNVDLEPGEYFVQIRHYSERRTGAYGIQVSR